MRKTLGAIAAVLLTSIASPAFAQQAEVTADLNMRAGPGTGYPVVTTIPDGRTVRVYGCVRGYDWCDVRWRNARGWVFSDYLDYRYNNRRRPVSEWGARLDLPIISFTFGDYAGRHYRGMPWYDGRDRWYGRDRDRDWDRGRGRDWDRGWDRDDRDRDRDRRRWRDDDLDRGGWRDRDWERDRERDRRRDDRAREGGGDRRDRDDRNWRSEEDGPADGLRFRLQQNQE